MGNVSTILVVGVTSLAGYLIGTRRFGLPRAELDAATRATLEAIGAGVVFLGANLALATLAVALARAATGGFVSLYQAIDDLALVALSLLQGSLFRWWWGHR